MEQSRTTAGSDERLLRVIGTWGLAAGIVNITIGGGIFRVPGHADVSGALGSSAPLAYLACATLMVLVMACIAQAGSRVSLTGGPYAYVGATLGPYTGFLVGLMLWLIGATAIPAVALIFADSAAAFVPALGSAAGRAVTLAIILSAVAYVNVRGVKQGMRLNGIFTAGKLIPLGILLVAGLVSSKVAAVPLPTVTLSALTFSRACVMLIFIFAGVEAALVPSGEVRDSERTVPRAVFLAVAFVTLVYIALQFVAQRALGAALVGDRAPLASAATLVLGTWGGLLISGGLLVSAFGYLSGMMLATPRALYAFARDGILPKQLAAVHPAYKSPWVAIAVQTVLVWALAITSSFEKLIVIANVSAVLIYLGCAVSALMIGRRARVSDVGFRIPGGLLIPVVTIVCLAALLTSVKADEWKILAIVLIVGSALYALARRGKNADA